MSFLDRFQGKIATVTAQGHLKKADGSEEIRVGPPKRRPQQQQRRVAGSNNANENGSNSSRLRQPAEVHARGDRARVVVAQAAPPPPVQTQRSPTKHVQASTTVSPRGKANADEGNSARTNYHESTRIPGRVRDDYDVDMPSARQTSSIKSPERMKNAPSQQQLKECRSPKEINEDRAVSEQDQLAFSRKARPVHYEPCKLSQYKKEKPDGYYELGKLQPDLNADDLVQKRANKERIKAFSKNLRIINKTAQARKPVEAGNEQTASSKPTSTRDKGLAFAKRLPKPKVPHQPVSEEDHTTISTTASQNNILEETLVNSVIDDDSDDDELTAEVLELQLRHQASRAQVDALVGSS
ncbi:hypothetical protein BBJ28_00022821 [Nothophytophthora sp. Chile5]|nr:hypothetical protein BBJ28_00022821 [Nothophytophthora sp. Chile5]